MPVAARQLCHRRFRFSQLISEETIDNVAFVMWCLFGSWLSITRSDQANRAISTSQLNVLPRLHLWPIDEVVYLGPQGYLVLRGASRLDAFSGYPVRT